ncbi:MAG TPA: queuosine salvage family protein [Chloroflexota bacterium]|nr:queuosine salvage family protein [Chloroflexota bacterium]
MGLLDDVRRSCALVAARAVHVRIATERLPAYAAALPLDRLARPTLDPTAHYLADEAGTVAYILTLDTINFGSGWFPLLRKRPGRSGYFTIALALKEAFEREGPWDAAALRTMTSERCAAVFGQDPDLPLMPLFAQALRDYGQLLHDRYGDDPRRLVASAEGSAERLVQQLLALPFYRDVARYAGQPVAFYKRAQLAAADLALALSQLTPPSPLGAFRDLHRLTIFADNLVPHVLRLDGVLQYAPALLARIEAEQPLEPGSPEEVEIRACAVHAVELLVAELARQGHRVTAHQLDYLLWNRGQEPRYKTRPRHRARTVFY